MTAEIAGRDPLADLVLVVEELRRQRDEDRALLEGLQIAVIHGESRTRQERRFVDWQTWVDDWLAVRISRRPQRVRWCHAYAEHAEVADRLEALWHAWEAQWPDPEARLSWLRDGLDHQLAVITADDGPLRECSAHEHQHIVPEPLAVGRYARDSPCTVPE